MDKIKNKLNPNWITGFVDAEGCFTIKSSKSERYKMGWFIQPSFQIKLHVKDKNILLQIKSFFGGIGTIWINNTYVYYKVRNINEIIRVIIPHFNKYPLITKKQEDFLLFENIIYLMSKGEHLNKEGLIKILNLRASLNKGLSDKLKIYFPEIIKIERSKVNLPLNLDPNWITGFFSGESCFFIDIFKSTNKIGYSITLRILIAQHLRDELLINKLRDSFNCGNVFKHSNKKAIVLSISKFDDIYFKMIPLFNKYKIKGVKYLDYKDFCKAGEIIRKGDHLKLEGLEKIRKIKLGMNRARYK